MWSLDGKIGLKGRQKVDLAVLWACQGPGKGAKDEKCESPDPEFRTGIPARPGKEKVHLTLILLIGKFEAYNDF